MVRRSLAGLLLALSAFSACAQESPQALRQAFLDAVRAGDVDALAALYSDDAISFPVGDMVVHGPEGVRYAWGPFLEAYDVTSIAFKDVQEEVMGDSALAWGMWTMTAVPRGRGETFDVEGRFMDLARKIDGNWRYVVGHASVPLWAEEGH